MPVHNFTYDPPSGCNKQHKFECSHSLWQAQVLGKASEKDSSLGCHLLAFQHIVIQFFAIQDWKDAGDIVMEHVPGAINASDDHTKPLGWFCI